MHSRLEFQVSQVARTRKTFQYRKFLVGMQEHLTRNTDGKLTQSSDDPLLRRRLIRESAYCKPQVKIKAYFYLFFAN